MFGNWVKNVSEKQAKLWKYVSTWVCLVAVAIQKREKITMSSDLPSARNTWTENPPKKDYTICCTNMHCKIELAHEQYFWPFQQHTEMTSMRV